LIGFGRKKGASNPALIVKILLLSALLILIFLPPTASWISSSLRRLDLVGGYTSIEVISSTGIGTDSPEVYVRNLGPRMLSLGYDKPRDPGLWQVFVGNEFFKVIEVRELGKEDNLFEVHEIICLRLEGKHVKGSWKMVTVYGPGATLADPPGKIESGSMGWLKGVLSKGKRVLSSALNSAKRVLSSARDKIVSSFSRVKEAVSSARTKLKERFKGYGLEKNEPEVKAAKGGGSFLSRAKDKLKYAWNWLKGKASSFWSWCKRHKKEIAVAGAVAAGAVITVLTLGSALPVIGSAAAGIKGAAITGVLGATGYGALSYAGTISLSLEKSVLIGFAVSSALYGVSKILNKPKKPNLDDLKPKGPVKPQIKGDLMEDLKEFEKRWSFLPTDPEEQLKIIEKLRPARPLEVDQRSQTPEILRVRRRKRKIFEWWKKSRKKVTPGPRHRKAEERLYRVANRFGESLHPINGKSKWKWAKSYGTVPDFESKNYIWEAETSSADPSHILGHLRGRFSRSGHRKGGFKRYASEYGKGIVIVFDKKPSRKVIELLIKHGFKAISGKVVWVWEPG